MVKKLVFAPIFLILLALLFFQTNSIISSSNSIFSLNLNDLLSLLVFCLLIVLSSLFFIIFISLANDFKIILPITLVAAILPFPFLSLPTALILSIGLLILLNSMFLFNQNKLKNYLNFDPKALFSPNIKFLIHGLVVLLSIIFYLNINSQIQKNGFELPDSLIDAALKFSATPDSINVKGVQYIAQLPSLTQDQINLLKQNPELLRQYGFDPKDLDNLQPGSAKSNNKNNTQVTNNATTPTNTSDSNFIKNLVKSQFQKLIEPYKNFIAPIITLLFFLTIYSITSILTIFVGPILWLIFYILEKSGFISFTKEMREVKKLVV